MILVIWQNHYGNNGDIIAASFCQLGYDVSVFTNLPLLGDNVPKIPDGGGTFSQFAPPQELHEQWLAERQARNDNRFDCFCPYLTPWPWTQQEWAKQSSEPPEFVIIIEGEWSPGGELPDGWADVPILYYGLDCPRGPDTHLRQASRAHATAILVNCRWYMPYYGLRRHMAAEVGDAIYHSGRPFDKVYWMPVSARWAEAFEKPLEEKPYDVLFMGNPGLEWIKNGEVVHKEELPDRHMDTTGETRLICDGYLHYGEYRQRGTLFRRLLEESPFGFHFFTGIAGEPYRAMLAAAKIVWNCQGGYECTHGGTTNRPLEAASVGTIPCTNWTDEICDLFEPDVEALIYPVSFCPSHSLFEWFDYALMREMIMDLLADQGRLDRMSIAALNRVKRDHLPVHRAMRILDIIREPEHVDINAFRPLHEISAYRR